jgi:signal transduction histidine kinase
MATLRPVGYHQYVRALSSQLTIGKLAASAPRRSSLLALAVLLAGVAALKTAPDTVFVSNWSSPLLAAVPVLLMVLTGVAVCAVAATCPRRASIPAALVASGVQMVSQGQRLAVFFQVGRISGISSPPALFMGLIAIIAWLAGHSIRLAYAHAEAVRAQALGEAVTAERLRIARDVHDQVAHAIGVIAIQAGAGRRVIGTRPDQARDALAAIEETSRETLAGLRHTVGALREAEPGRHGRRAPLGPRPGLADLDWLVASTRDAGVLADVRWVGDRRQLPADVDTCAFRIIQEAVTNVVRHSGTSRCVIQVSQRPGELSIEVTDDGQGGLPAGTGYGITGMRERAELLRGQFSARPRPEGGFQVVALLPVPVAA